MEQKQIEQLCSAAQKNLSVLVNGTKCDPYHVLSDRESKELFLLCKWPHLTPKQPFKIALESITSLEITGEIYQYDPTYGHYDEDNYYLG